MAALNDPMKPPKPNDAFDPAGGLLVGPAWSPPGNFLTLDFTLVNPDSSSTMKLEQGRILGEETTSGIGVSAQFGGGDPSSFSLYGNQHQSGQLQSLAIPYTTFRMKPPLSILISTTYTSSGWFCKTVTCTYWFRLNIPR